MGQLKKIALDKYTNGARQATAARSGSFYSGHEGMERDLFFLHDLL